jgi:hypothetical protein
LVLLDDSSFGYFPALVWSRIGNNGSQRNMVWRLIRFARSSIFWVLRLRMSIGGLPRYVYR